MDSRSSGAEIYFRYKLWDGFTANTARTLEFIPSPVWHTLIWKSERANKAFCRMSGQLEQERTKTTRLRDQERSATRKVPRWWTVRSPQRKICIQDMTFTILRPRTATAFYSTTHRRPFSSFPDLLAASLFPFPSNTLEHWSLFSFLLFSTPQDFDDRTLLVGYHRTNRSRTFMTDPLGGDSVWPKPRIPPSQALRVPVSGDIGRNIDCSGGNFYFYSYERFHTKLLPYVSFAV